MSLRGFHIVFITVCTLLCAFLILWAFVLAPEPSTLATVLGYTGIVGILLMPLYGFYFYRKAVKLNL
jgi:ABC-type phosphate/phosphonate transport system permease subunit